jgi:uncharacterized phage protein (TIGR01671 family)
MREIKFRYWNMTHPEMVYNAGVLPLNHFAEFSSGPDGLYVRPGSMNRILMQFTGLCDKNGKEIWEGDVIKSKPYVFHGEWLNGIVHWSDQRGQWRVRSIKWDDELENLTELLRPEHESEVIGNIYDNPELIKDTV